jgi:heat shock protein HslJ
VAITADFGADQSFTVHACNTMRATYVADGEMLTISAGAATLMACEGDLGEIEGAVFALLPDVMSHNVTDGVLTMSDADGNPLLVWVQGVPAAADGSALDGTSWILTDYSADNSVIAVPEGITITGAFAEGQFSGQACNNYFTSYTTDGSSLSFDVVGSTMMMCDGPIAEIESAYFLSLENVTNFAIEDGILKFLDDNGALIAAFSDDNSAVADPAHVQEGGSDLAGTNWQVTGYTVDGVFSTPDSSFAATLDLAADGSYSGQVCNGYRGTYTVDGNSISFGPAVMTMMACVGPVGEFEPIFHELLASATSFEMVGSELSLMNDAGEVVLQFAAYAPATLEGPIWNATGINNGREAVQSLIAETSATATFAGGTVSGNAGCNTYSAPYTLDGSNLTIGMAAVTAMMCVEPEGLAEQETSFLTAMANVATWEIHNGVLTLRDANGSTQVTFVQ